ncbi:MAG: DUF1295 domain-containing protein [Bacteroidota bacterium]
MENIFTYSALLIFIYMVSWFVIALLKKDNGIVDVAWGLGFTLVAWMGYLNFSGTDNATLILVLMVSLWGVRLATHIFIRGLGKPEDFRYKAWREAWGNTFFVRTFLQVFMLQGFFMFIISLPILKVLSSSNSVVFPWEGTSGINWLLIIGFLIWLVGFLWESIGDYQLFVFKKDPANKGKIMTTGLWSLSRHPNYFGEAVLWWGIFIFSIPFGEWWISIIGPITLSWLLLRVSGVPMLERKYKKNPEYQAYIDATPAFFPIPKK